MEAAGLGLGAVGLTFQFFHTAKVALKCLGDMKQAAKQQHETHTLFQLQVLRYEKWAEAIGLESDGLAVLVEQYNANPATIALIIDVLTLICNLVTQKDMLTGKYGLKARLFGSRHDEEAGDLKIGPQLVGTAPPVWSDEERQRRENNLLICQKRLSNFQKFKWAVDDKRKFKELVDSLRKFNDDLVVFLPRPQQNILDRSMLIHQPNSLEVLEILAADEFANLSFVSQSFSRAAKIKSMSIRQSMNISTQGRRPSPADAVELPASRVSYDRGTQRRVLGAIDDTSVLVEFKEIAEQERRVVFENRLKNLVGLLQISPKPENYRILDCEGFFVANREPLRYGIVFSLPHGVLSTEKPRLNSLYSVLRGRDSNEVPIQYPLGARFRLATRLASSISELHAAGWLHHNITSDNVICLSGTDPADIEMPYLSGFDFARLDDPREISEIHSRSGDSNYRHPDYQIDVSNDTTKVKFRRSYELYSLGVVLLEIGLWKRIETFRKPGHSPAQFSRFLRDNVAPYLGYYMGMEYKEAVLHCLDSSRLGAGSAQGKELLEAFSRKVVLSLESCRV